MSVDAAVQTEVTSFGDCRPADDGATDMCPHGIPRTGCLLFPELPLIHVDSMYIRKLSIDELVRGVNAYVNPDRFRATARDFNGPRPERVQLMLRELLYCFPSCRPAVDYFEEQKRTFVAYDGAELPEDLPVYLCSLIRACFHIHGPVNLRDVKLGDLTNPTKSRTIKFGSALVSVLDYSKTFPPPESEVLEFEKNLRSFEVQKNVPGSNACVMVCPICVGVRAHRCVSGACLLDAMTIEVLNGGVSSETHENEGTAAARTALPSVRRMSQRSVEKPRTVTRNTQTSVAPPQQIGVSRPQPVALDPRRVDATQCPTPRFQQPVPCPEPPRRKVIGVPFIHPWNYDANSGRPAWFPVPSTKPVVASVARNASGITDDARSFDPEELLRLLDLNEQSKLPKGEGSKTETSERACGL